MFTLLEHVSPGNPVELTIEKPRCLKHLSISVLDGSVANVTISLQKDSDTYILMSLPVNKFLIFDKDELFSLPENSKLKIESDKEVDVHFILLHPSFVYRGYVHV